MADAPRAAVDKAARSLEFQERQFVRAGEVAKKIVTTPLSMANSVLGFARNSATIAKNASDSLGRTPCEVLTTKQRVADVNRAAKYFGQIQDGFDLVAQKSTALDARMREALVAGANRGALHVKASATVRAGDIVAIHVCHAGDTPQRVSQKYFGNPDQGEAILRANRRPLHTPTFRQGLILVIPALQNAPKTV